MILFGLPAVCGVFATIFALLKGGRYERLVGLLFLLRGVAMHLRTLAWWPEPVVIGPLYHQLTFGTQLAYMAGLTWLLARHRPGWLLGLAAFEIAYTAESAFTIADPALASSIAWLGPVSMIAKSGCLLWGVIRHHFAPPMPVPGEAVFRAALGEWL